MDSYLFSFENAGTNGMSKNTTVQKPIALKGAGKQFYVACIGGGPFKSMGHWMNSRSFAVLAFVLSTAALSIGGNAWSASLSSSQKVEVKVDPAKIDEDAKILWERFGGFCQIAEWHPVVLSCTEGREGDAVYRTLSLKDGGKIKEKLLSSGPLNYHYAIVESPLPVKNYESEFSVSPNKDEVDVVWSSTYDAADGRSDQEARSAIEGVYKDGIVSIKGKLPIGTDNDKSEGGDKK